MSFASIDLGTGRTKGAIPDPQGNPVMLTNSLGELFIPSVAYFDKGRTIIGTEAWNAGLADPSQFVSGWKRHMGADKVLAKGHDGKDYRAKEIGALLLTEMKMAYEAKTGQPLKECIITIPANYNDGQRAHTLEAARMAGVGVIQLVHEPVAAAFGNDIHRRGDGIALVADLGSGTFDVSLLQVSGNSVSTLSTSGEPELGGMDFDRKLREMILDDIAQQSGTRPSPQSDPLLHQDLLTRTETIKISLTQRDQISAVFIVNGKPVKVTVTRAKFEAATKDLLERAMARIDQALKEAALDPARIKDFVAVGGATLMPMFNAAVESRFGRKPQAREPNYAAAQGGVVLGRLELEKQGRTVSVNGQALPPVGIHARDITTHAIGVTVLDGGQKLFNSAILPKGVPIPADRTVPFKLAEPNQPEALIEILQGPDQAPRNDCLLLGHFELKGLKPVQDEIHRVEVRLKIDRNGMLSAWAYDPSSGISADLVIDYKKHPGKAA